MSFEIKNNAVNRQPGMKNPGRAGLALRKKLMSAGAPDYALNTRSVGTRKK
jgi:hypothetical protein